jgi:heme O synthase-like polyprenyltransferase
MWALFWAGALATLGSAIAFYNFPLSPAAWVFMAVLSIGGWIYGLLALGYVWYVIDLAWQGYRNHKGQKPQRALLVRFFLAYRMTSRTAKLLRVAYYAIFVFLIVAAIGTVSDALSHSRTDRSYVASDVGLCVVVALLTLIGRFASAGVEFGVAASRTQFASEPESIDVPNDVPTQYAPVVPDDAAADPVRSAPGHSAAE